jgi:hemoglobin
MTEVPSLYEWLGGMPALERLTTTFYARVPSDPILSPVFAGMPREHAAHVAEFLAEVLGGPQTYSSERGGHPSMIRHHLSRSLTEVQRRRWLAMLLECADEIGLPDDPEFRSAFLAYLEWGTRLAVLNSQPGASVTEDVPMPRWGWGEVKGPYVPKAES